MGQIEGAERCVALVDFVQWWFPLASARTLDTVLVKAFMLARLFILAVVLQVLFLERVPAQLEQLADLQDKGFEIDVAGETDDDSGGLPFYSDELGAITMKGGVRVKYLEMLMYADQVSFWMSTGDIFLDGNVRIYRGDLVFQGEGAIFNHETGKLTANELRGFQEPMLFAADNVQTTVDPIDPAPEILESEDAIFTTHDSATPNYYLKARKIKLYPEPENRVEMHDVKLYVGNRAVFWFPYLSQSLDESLGWYLRPGFNSNWGAYLQSEYGIPWDDHTMVRYQFDVRSRRGLAGGVELESERFKENENLGRLKLYYANDTDPQVTSTERTRRSLNEDRYRVSLQHRIYLPGPEKSSLYLDLDINHLSDEFVYEDFFPNEYKIDPNPENMVNLVKTHPRGTLSLLTRFNANEFFRSDERLPELALDFTRQPIFDTGAFYEGETSVGAYREHLSSLEEAFLRGEGGNFEDFFGVPASALSSVELRTFLDELEAQIKGYSFKRFDTYHQLAYPISLQNSFSLVPRVGFRHTHYFDIDPGTSDFDGTASRTLFHAGFEGAFKLSRVYSDVQVPAMGLDQVRHIMEPYFNYSFLAGDDLASDVPRIDRLTPSTRLRPIDLSKFTAVDALDPWNVLRLGVRNVVQTKRDGETYNWLQLNTYFDTFFEDGEHDRSYSNLYNELVWQPLPWLQLEIESQLPVISENQGFIEWNSRLRFMPTRKMEFSMGHRFLNDHPFFGDSNLVNLRMYRRLTESWGFGADFRYELDDNTLEHQQYSFHRDLTSWTAALGALVRDNRGEEEYGLVFTLTLKDLPHIRLPISLDPTDAGR